MELISVIAFFYYFTFFFFITSRVLRRALTKVKDKVHVYCDVIDFMRMLYSVCTRCYCCSKEFSVAPLRRPFDFECFAAACVYTFNLKTYYVVTTIEKSEKFVDGGKTVVF